MYLLRELRVFLAVIVGRASVLIIFSRYFSHMTWEGRQKGHPSSLCALELKYGRNNFVVMQLIQKDILR